MGKRRIVRVRVNWFYIGKAMERDEFGLRVGLCDTKDSCG